MKGWQACGRACREGAWQKKLVEQGQDLLLRALLRGAAACVLRLAGLRSPCLGGRQGRTLVAGGGAQSVLQMGRWRQRSSLQGARWPLACITARQS